jgi:hypothetical protein
MNSSDKGVHEKAPLLSQPVVAVPYVGNANVAVAGEPIQYDMHRIEVRVAEVEDFLAPEVPGIMIRERMFPWQVFCGVCEKQSQFKVANVPPVLVEDPEDEYFTSQPASFQVREQSECFQRYCCHQMRHLRLGMFPVGGSMQTQGEAPGWPGSMRPSLVMEKPLRVPLVCCCFMLCPPEMNVVRPTSASLNYGNTPNIPVDGEYFGRIVCDWKWWNCFYPCETYMNVLDEKDEVQYILHRADGCGAGCRNCCAPSCFQRTHRTFIKTPSGQKVGEMQNIWPGWNVRGLCQGNSAADNFILDFPADSDYRQKSLLMGGLFLANYVFWERRANQK